MQAVIQAVMSSLVARLVTCASPEDGGVDDVGPVGGADDEHVLLAAHAVHLRQDLVDHSVRGAWG